MAALLKEHMEMLNDLGRKAQEKAANNTKVVAKKRKTRKTSTLNATDHADENEQRLDVEQRLNVAQNNFNMTHGTFLVGLNETNVTAFEPPDPMLLASRMFRSDGKKVEPNPNATYGTTVGLILLLHVVFAYQWNSRKSRRDVLTSYHELVHKKQIHRAIGALVSHPPADSSFLSREGLVSLAIEMGDSNAFESGRIGRLRNKCKSFVERLHPLTYGHLSGLPLLTYNSHLLWSCRALEALCPSSWYYARVLLVLAMVSFLLELRLAHNLLQTSRALIGLSLNPNAPSVSDSHRFVKHRTMGTPTMLTAALLLIYYCCFPFVAMPILPFLPVSRRMDVGLSYFMCYTLLTALSWKSHPVTSILCGACSGLSWVLGITSFFGDKYWGACVLFWIVVASLLSLRVSYGAWLPWIDFVAWNAQGRIQYDEPNLDEQHEEDDEEPPEDDVGSLPLLSRRSDSVGLRGRLPMMDMEDDIEMARSSPSRGLQQRRSGLDSSHPRYE